jgi:hypothetical protein
MEGAITTAGIWARGGVPRPMGALQSPLQPRRLLALGKGVEVVVVSATPQITVEGVEVGVLLRL